MATKKYTFYEFGDFANELVGTKFEKARWMVDSAGRIDRAIYLSIPPDNTAVIRNWPNSFAVEAQQKNRVQDMPCTLSCRPVVSDRLRILIEQWSPGSAQYLPVRIMWRGQRIKGRFWIANWSTAVECVNWRQSIPRTKPLPKEPVVFEKLVVDTNRVPSNTHVFVVRHAVQTVLCTSELRQEIERQGITGCQFLTL